jgi:cyanobactin cluster PatC/TenC/TruC protein
MSRPRKRREQTTSREQTGQEQITGREQATGSQQRSREQSGKRMPAKPQGSAAAPTAELAITAGEGSILNQAPSMLVMTPTLPQAPPVRVEAGYDLETGLSDYGMWVEMFPETDPPVGNPNEYRRGRIWA